MGMEKIDFIWYMKKMSLLAMVGYFAGIGTYWAQEQLLGASEEVEETHVTIVEDRAHGIISDETTVHLDTEMFIGTKHVSEGEEATEEHATAEATEEFVVEEIIAVEEVPAE